MADAGKGAQEFADRTMAEHRAREAVKNGEGRTAIASSYDPMVYDGTTHETVSYTAGEELYTPRQFCSYRVGPMSGMTEIRKGETRPQAGERLRQEIKVLMDVERREKHASFIAALRSVFEATKGES